MIKRMSMIFVLLMFMSTFSSGTAYANVANKQKSNSELYFGGFNGTWVGKLHLFTPNLTKFSNAFDFENHMKSKWLFLKLIIKDHKVRVLVRENKKWKDIKSGEFYMAAYKTSAVIFTIDSAEDVYDKTGNGGWVETWDITVTHKNNHALYAYFVRSVNNYLRPYNERDKKTGIYIGRFFTNAFGELDKLQD